MNNPKGCICRVLVNYTDCDMKALGIANENRTCIEAHRFVKSEYDIDEPCVKEMHDRLQDVSYIGYVFEEEEEKDGRNN